MTPKKISNELFKEYSKIFERSHYSKVISKLETDQGVQAVQAFRVVLEALLVLVILLLPGPHHGSHILGSQCSNS